MSLNEFLTKLDQLKSSDPPCGCFCQIEALGEADAKLTKLLIEFPEFKKYIQTKKERNNIISFLADIHGAHISLGYKGD